MDSVTINACAKINLYLDITGRRKDGYHLLNTVMHSVSLCDTVTAAKNSGGIIIRCDKPHIPCDERNIAYKCAAAFFSKTGLKGKGAAINIKKNIPDKAGLGGGSADGAAVLTALDRLYETGLGRKELIAIGAELGADIPFCLTGGCCLCTGIGEIIEPLPAKSGCLVIAKGEKGISTAEAFREADSGKIHFDLPFDRSAFSEKKRLTDLAPYCGSIFDSICREPQVLTIKNIMRENGGSPVLMTGSGSAVFGAFEDEQNAHSAQLALKSCGFFAEITSPVSDVIIRRHNE